MNLGVYAHKLPQKAVSEGAPQISCYLEGRAPVLSVVTWWPVEQGMTIHCHSTCQLHIWEPFGTDVINSIKIKYITMGIY